MYILAEITGVVAELLLANIYFNGFFSKRSCNRWLIGSVYFPCGIILAILSLLVNASFLRLTFCAISLTLIVFTFFHASIFQAVFASISYCGLCVLNELLIFGILSIFHIDVKLIMFSTYARSISIIIFHTQLWLCVLVVLAISKYKRTAITLPFLLTLTPGYCAGIILGISFCKQVLAGDEGISVPVLVSAIGLLYLNIVIVLYAERAKNASDQKLRAELAENHYSMQEQYYAQLRREQEETRSMFHDINKYMQAMRTLAAEANVEKVNQMMAETQELFDGLSAAVDVGNSVVSVILNEYKGVAEDASIPLDYDISIPQNLGVSAVDLYVILGNTLDNAVEACLSLPVSERYIRIQMRIHHSILFCQIENPYANGYHLRKRSADHGYGLQNVQKCIQKYHGHMSISQEGNKYILSMRLNDCVPSNYKLLEYSGL